MQHRLVMFILLLWPCVHALAQDVQPKKRLFHPYAAIGLLVTMPNSDSFNDSHTGLLVGGGVRLPIDHQEHFNVLIGLQYASKGMQYNDEYYRIIADANYLVVPVNIYYNFAPESKFSYMFGCGLYVAYGISESMKVPKDLYYFEGFPVDGHRNIFKDGNFPRCDVGGQLINALKFKQASLFMSIDFSFLKKRMIGGRQDLCNLCTFSMGVSYEL